MTRFLYDTAVFVYAVGADHPYRDPCRRIVAAARDGSVAGEASVELVHELAHVLVRRGGDRARALKLTGAAASLVRLHDFSPGDLPLVMTLLADHPALDVRDAVFAATALNRGVALILSPDRAYDEVPGLDRLDPAAPDVLARLAD
jgi:predicted nucleic acid-binding protein